MTHDEFDAILEKRIAAMRAVLGKKAGEYATDGEQLHNFKAGAAITGESPAQVCLGYMTKHLVSVLDMVQRDSVGTLPTAELLDEKIGDLINYVVLLEANLREGMR